MVTGTRLDRWASASTILAAVVVAGAVVHRALRHSPPARSPSTAVTQRIPDSLWEAATGAGELVGGTNTSPVTIVEFTDLECPACRGFQPILDALTATRSSDVRVLYVPHPLGYHRFALAAANAAECAAEIGALPRWIAAVFRGQDSLVLKTWGQFARSAGIHDTARIARCAIRRDTASRVARGLALGSALGGVGTPTLIVQGLRFSSPPSRQELDAAVDRGLAAVGPPAPEGFLSVGQVLDSVSGRALGGAAVSFLDSSGTVAASTRSDTGGWFELRGPRGRFRVTVTRTGYVPLVGHLADLQGRLPPYLVYLAPGRGPGR